MRQERETWLIGHRTIIVPHVQQALISDSFSCHTPQSNNVKWSSNLRFWQKKTWTGLYCNGMRSTKSLRMLTKEWRKWCRLDFFFSWLCGSRRLQSQCPPPPPPNTGPHPLKKKPDSLRRSNCEVSTPFLMGLYTISVVLMGLKFSSEFT